jgi:hypothetical protein
MSVISQSRIRVTAKLVGPALTLCLLILAGCEGNSGKPLFTSGQNPSPEQVSKMLEPNVIQVVAFFKPQEMNPWIWAEDRSRVQGIFITSLFLSGPDGKGVFGDGVIRPFLYVAKETKDGNKKWEKIKEWSIGVREAMPYRAKKKTAMGWGYGLIPLDWGDMDLSHKHVRVVISFERRDGRVITRRSRQEFQVPAGG